MHPASSSVRVLQAKVSICQQKFVQFIIRRVGHVTFKSLTVSRLRKRSSFVARSLDWHEGLKVATHVWRWMPRQIFVCCDVSVLAPIQPRPYTLHVIYKIHRIRPLKFSCCFSKNCLTHANKTAPQIFWFLILISLIYFATASKHFCPVVNSPV